MTIGNPEFSFLIDVISVISVLGYYSVFVGTNFAKRHKTNLSLAYRVLLLLRGGSADSVDSTLADCSWLLLFCSDNSPSASSDDE